MASDAGKIDDSIGIREVKKLLGKGWSDDQIYLRIKKGILRPKKIDGRLRFPRAATELAIARMLEEAQGKKISEGQRDALATKLLAQGFTEGQVCMELDMEIERVAMLRRGLEGGAIEPRPSSSTMRAAARERPPSEPRQRANDPFFDQVIRESRRRLAALKRGE